MIQALTSVLTINRIDEGVAIPSDIRSRSQRPFRGSVSPRLLTAAFYVGGNMDNSYIAGFFDGEGSAMALTIRRITKRGISYRIRPCVKISQATRAVLDVIRNHLGYGRVIGSKNERGEIYNLQINGCEGIIRFATEISPYVFLKRKQLLLLVEIAKVQIEHWGSNTPYPRADFERMIDMRDAVFEANTWTRSRIKQKYPKAIIMKEHSFVDDIQGWHSKRVKAGIAARRECYRLHGRKLNLAKVIEIRSRLAAGGVTQNELAKEYGVGQAAISHAKRKANF